LANTQFYLGGRWGKRLNAVEKNISVDAVLCAPRPLPPSSTGIVGVN